MQNLFFQLSVPKTAIAIAAFSTCKFKVATLTADSTENRGVKNRGMISRTAAFSSQCFVPVKTNKGKSNVPKLSKPKNCCVVLGGAISNRNVPAFSKPQRFRDAKFFGRASRSKT